MVNLKSLDKKLKLSFQAMKKDIMSNKDAVEKLTKDFETVQTETKHLQDISITFNHSIS